MRVLIRADSSSSIGTGHIMRDLVLAKQFYDSEVIFATLLLEGNINHKIKEAGYALAILESNSIDELDILIKKLSIDLLIIDNYEIDYDFEKKIKYRNPKLKIFVLDDTYEEHYCDILLNHNINADVNRYCGLVPQYCELRCGSEYTLLREEFLLEKLKLKKKNMLKTIFVAMGGSDHANKNISILKVLEKIDNLQVSIVTTTANKYLKELHDYCIDKPWISLEINSNEIARLMRQSDFAIVTPSVTVNEVYFMELPFIAIKTADNQKEVFSFLKKKKYIVLEGFDEAQLRLSIIELMEKL